MRLPYAEQLEQKRARVRESVLRYAALAGLEVADVAAAEPRVGYRTRAKVMVASGGRVGLFAASGDHEVVDTPGCIVLSPVLARVLAALRPMIAADERAGGGLAPRASREGGGLVAVDLREVVPASGTGPVSGEANAGALVTWVVARGPELRLERLRASAAALREAVPEVLGVAVNFHEGESPQVLGAETLPLAGQSWGEDTIGGVAHRATFGSFVQAHRGQAARVHAAIAAGLTTGVAARPPRVLDLYGGSGAIALGLAARGAQVVMVESFAPAVEQATRSANAAGLAVTAECRDVAVALRDFARTRARPERRFDAAVVNPPRRGLDPEVRASLAALDLDRVVYVSCQPETLARDLGHLARLGYATTSLEPFDMIPLTDEVETVAIIRRGAVPPPAVLFEDREVVVVDKPPHEPTTPQGEHAGSLLDRVHRLPGAGGAVAVHRLDVGTSGVVVFAKDPALAGAWATALQKGGRKTYVAAVRGVPDERGTVDRPLTILGKSKQARTQFERVSLLGNHAVLRVVPEEGRTHQIRRHLAAIGHPVLGDARYGHAPTNRFFHERHGLDRTFLHAATLELVHPTTARRLVVEAALPGDLASVLASVERGRP